MSTITLETRRKSYNEIKHTLSKRETEVLEALGDKEMTANEIAYKLYQEGKTPFFNRNYASPRLTALENWGIVEVVGKKKDFVGKTCCLYKKSENKSENDFTKCGKESVLFEKSYEMEVELW